jgi:hypothetical protein
MKLVVHARLFNLLLIACSALCLGANLARAQGSVGRFNLPVETYWGQVILPPGSYSFVLNSAAADGMITVRGQGKVAMIPITSGISTGGTSEASNLLLVTQAGKTNVSSLYLGHLGVTLRYRAPKLETLIIAVLPGVNQHMLISALVK